jgi:hypothetical protein
MQMPVGQIGQPAVKFSTVGTNNGVNIAYKGFASLPIIGFIVRGNILPFALRNLIRVIPVYDVNFI